MTETRYRIIVEDVELYFHTKEAAKEAIESMDLPKSTPINTVQVLTATIKGGVLLPMGGDGP